MLTYYCLAKQVFRKDRRIPQNPVQSRQLMETIMRLLFSCSLINLSEAFDLVALDYIVALLAAALATHVTIHSARVDLVPLILNPSTYVIITHRELDS